MVARTGAGYCVIALGALAALSVAACGSASPALTLGATAVFRDVPLAPSAPPTLRAGAWLTWHTSTAANPDGHAAHAESAPMPATPATRAAAEPRRDASWEPPCAATPVCAWARREHARALVLAGVTQPATSWRSRSARRASP